jgi:hypothetical protein
MWKALIKVLLAATAGVCALGCGYGNCDCASDVLGLVISTGAPVTDIALSGPACREGKFRCIPNSFDNTIHGDCTRIQIEAAAEGLCIVSLVSGGASVRVERTMTRRPAGCCGGFIGEANYAGEIDLRQSSDGGSDGAVGE